MKLKEKIFLIIHVSTFQLFLFPIPFHYWNIFCTDTRFFCGIGRFQETTEVFSALSKRIKSRQNVYMRLFLFTALAAFLVFPACPAFADIAGRASVIDGDTIEIRGQRIRLWELTHLKADKLAKETVKLGVVGKQHPSPLPTRSEQGQSRANSGIRTVTVVS